MIESGNENIQSAILFDTKDEALESMTLAEHIVRLTSMKDFLNSAISKNKLNLTKLREVSKAQTSELQTAYQILQSQTRSELERMKRVFEPSMNLQRKQLSEMKAEVAKINAEQLSTKKLTLNSEALIDHCQNQMGYVQLLNKSSR